MLHGVILNMGNKINFCDQLVHVVYYSVNIFHSKNATRMQIALALSCTHSTSSSATSLCLAKVSPPKPFSCDQRQYFFQRQFKLQWDIPLCKMLGLAYLHSECSAEVSLPHSSCYVSISVQAEGRERGALTFISAFVVWNTGV